jgi:hypothetical protein
MMNNPLAQAMGPGAGAQDPMAQAPAGGAAQSGAQQGLGGPNVMAMLAAANAAKGGKKAKRITKGKRRHGHKKGRHKRKK